MFRRVKRIVAIILISIVLVSGSPVIGSTNAYAVSYVDIVSEMTFSTDKVNYGESVGVTVKTSFSEPLQSNAVLYLEGYNGSTYTQIQVQLTKLSENVYTGTAYTNIGNVGYEYYPGWLEIYDTTGNEYWDYTIASRLPNAKFKVYRDWETEIITDEITVLPGGVYDIGQINLTSPGSYDGSYPLAVVNISDNTIAEAYLSGWGFSFGDEDQSGYAWIDFNVQGISQGTATITITDYLTGQRVKIIKVNVGEPEFINETICVGNYLYVPVSYNSESLRFDFGSQNISYENAGTSIEDRSSSYKHQIMEINSNYVDHIEGYFSVQVNTVGSFYVNLLDDSMHVLKTVWFTVREHEFDDGVVIQQKNCIRHEKTEYTCIYCGRKEYSEGGEYGDHQWDTEYSVDVAATCIEEGVESIHCTVCDTKKEGTERTTTIIPHSYGEWTTVIEPTCVSEGSQERSCSYCGDTETEEIPADPDKHVWGDWFIEKEATCVDAGIKTRVCNLDSNHTETSAILATGVHNYVDGVCTVCGEKQLVSSGNCGSPDKPSVKYYYYGDGTLVIKGEGDFNSFEFYHLKSKIKAIVIEEGVTSIEEQAFFSYTNITDVTIPESVTSIGDRAFYSCSNLKSITIPESVTSIGDSAFYGCISITSITIPDGVTSIGKYTFGNCSNLKSITIPGSVTSIGERAFFGCSSLTSIIIPNSVIEIGEYAFYGCNSMESISLPFVGKSRTENSKFCYIFGESSGYYIPASLKMVTITGDITVVEEKAFSDCSRLTTITLPEGVTSIGENAFYNCSSLMSIAIPGSVTSIGQSAFRGCNKLESIALPFIGGSRTENTFIGFIFGADQFGANGSYVPASLKRILITGNITNISEHAFSDCSSIESITLPESITNIGQCAFNNCSSLKSITIPENVISIGEYAFSACSSLASVIINDGVTSIGEWAFSNCSSLKSITIPESVKSIGYLAFNNCTGLETISLPFVGESRTDNTYLGYIFGASDYYQANHVPSSLKEVIITGDITNISEYAFYYCSSIESITLPESITSIGQCAFYCCNSLTSINIPAGVKSIEYGVFSGCSSLKSINIPDGVTSIGSSAFSSCYGLNSMSLPENVTSICSCAFDNCSGLTSIVLPDHLISIGNSAFRGCTSLSGIQIPDSVTDIDGWAFQSCTGLKSISLPQNMTNIVYGTFSGCISLESVIIPESVTSIGNQAFKNCTSLKTIDLPSSLIEINHYAFSGCTGLVGTLRIPFSVKTIGYQAFYGCTGLNELVINGDCNITGNDSFGECTIERIILLEGSKTTDVCSGVPRDCLKEVIIPEGVEIISDSSFHYCTAITSIKLPESTADIGDSAFYNCENLEAINIPVNVKSIGVSAFAGCSKIQKVIIPTGTTYVGSCAFSRCSGLKYILIPETVTEIGNYAIDQCDSLNKVYVVKDSYADNWISSNGFSYLLKYVTKESGHYYYEEVTKESSYEKTGLKTLTCVICCDAKTEEIPKLLADGVSRIFGSTRFETSLKVADELKILLGKEKFDTIILAYAYNYADALAGSYLSCILEAPILVVDARQDHINAVQTYIKANLNKGGTIYMLGGAAVVPDSAVAGLNGYTVNRLWGQNRYETNIAILREAAKFNTDNEIIVASGNGFADSLSAAAAGKPILLVRNTLQDCQIKYLKELSGSLTFDIIGGTGAVSESLRGELKAYGNTNRTGGSTRYETSVNVAKKFFDKPQAGVVAYGQDFPDGLCGGALAYAMNGPLILAGNGRSNFAEAYAGEVGMKYGAVLGGPTLINDDATRAIYHMSGGAKILVK